VGLDGSKRLEVENSGSTGQGRALQLQQTCWTIANTAFDSQPSLFGNK
jgi:hypothetical protein